jgi:hypothetical protein
MYGNAFWVKWMWARTRREALEQGNNRDDGACWFLLARGPMVEISILAARAGISYACRSPALSSLDWEPKLDAMVCLGLSLFKCGIAGLVLF